MLDSIPDRALPALLLLNQNLYKWRTTSSVSCWVRSHRGAYIGAEGSLHQLSKICLEQMDDLPTSHSSWPPPPSSLGSFLMNQRRDVTIKSRAEPTHTLAGWPRSWASQPAPRPTCPRVWCTWSTWQIHPRGDSHFDIWLTSLCNPLKCSYLVPKFLKSNKHKSWN
jgi:hypothetical protein